MSHAPDYDENHLTESSHPGPPAAESNNIYVLVFGGLMLGGLMFLAWMGRTPRSVAIGEPLPRLDLQPLVNTDQIFTNADIEGKLTVLHFWGTWCPPCQKEFPEFVELAGKFDGNNQVAILSISCSGGPEYDLADLKQKTVGFYSKFPNQIPTYSDSAAMTREQLALLLPNGSFGYPTTLLVGRDGRIIELLEGYLPGEMQALAATIQSNLQL
jgi:thiol-disulfide isomerase/thioredoxin